MLRTTLHADARLIILFLVNQTSIGGRQERQRGINLNSKKSRLCWCYGMAVAYYNIITAMKKIGKYEVLKPIGEGSFGKVYLVSFEGQQFALKTIPKRPHSTREIRSLSEETQLLMKLKHDNIIAMRESFETPE